MKEYIVDFIVKQLINKWPRVLTLIILQIPFIVENPPLLTAIKQFMLEPTNVTYISNVITQLILVFGVMYGVKIKGPQESK